MTASPTNINSPCFLKDRAAQYLVGDRVFKEIKKVLDKDKNIEDYNGLKHFLSIPGLPIPVLSDETGPLNLPPPPDKVAQPKQPMADLPNTTLYHVCIVGAGITGLFMATLLDELSPFVTYEILESSDRTGGRVYTHSFPQDPDKPPVWYNYYDAGAMRFPDIPIMDRVFKLFERLGITESSGLLIPYYLFGINCPQRYNSITYIPQEGGPSDPFNFSVSNNGLVPDKTVNYGADAILDDAFGYYKESLRRNFEKGFKTLMRADSYTMREYLCQVMGYDFYSIQYLETVSGATGQYSQAFTESVLESLNFDYCNGQEVNWFCIKGGTSVLTNKLVERIRSKPCINNLVTSIRYDQNAESRPVKVKVTSGNKSEEKCYDLVFTTTSLSCMQRMNLDNAGLSRAQHDAIRCLEYDASTKVAIEFDTPWWITMCNISQGGVASTDLPLRTCIYPSYITRDAKPAVLLCSYSFARDAQRMGSLISYQEQLKELLLHNLTLLHYESAGLTYEDMHKQIAEQFRAIHGHDWNQDPNTSGAFAFFGPGQFANYYPELIEPAAGGRLLLAGEACSAHHAWIAGSLDSAYRALSQFIRTVKWGRWLNVDGLLKKLEDNWGVLREIQPEALEWQAILMTEKQQRK
ncbi:hypothetical protein EYZ11_000416 [Aspergillus tanneri]|uniref:Amine oxidase domain-containing protein n=1 Tax=Aspergillus tanneri TaxID=1220188 RepID=A0A4V3UQU6_9EURO|nr:uncharacterized protein ATNIH1004_006802 [Aspergillus tanneri]KAA8645383.1 hypothetical protein ATNIH1004_006802 [Aspergillus tanneri]THD00091.1 hypothetical protein EYZ11_000416 [Aspergillus tanneri]